MPDRTVTILRNLKLDPEEFLSIVDKGAGGNDEHRPAIVVFKRHKKGTKTMPKKIAKKLTGLDLTNEQFAKIVALMLEKKGIKEVKKQDLAALGLDEAQMAAVAAMIEAAQAEGCPRETDVEASDHEDEDTEKQEDEDEDEEKQEDDDMPKTKYAKIAKDLAKQLRKATDLLSKSNDRIDALEKKDEDRTYLAKAKDLGHVPGVSVDDLAKVIKCAEKDLGKEEGAAILKTLGIMNKIAKTSKVFESQGSANSGLSEPMQKLEKLAEEIQKRDKISKRRAMAKAQKEDPVLYAEVRDY